MTDDELLELLERVFSNLDMTSKVAASHRDPHADQVLDFNRGLRRLIEAGLDVEEWLIPEDLLRRMYGQKRLPNGQLVDLKRVSAEEFFLRANPAMKYLAREITRRKRARIGGSSMTRNSPNDSSEVWVIHGRDEEFRRLIFAVLRAVRLEPIEFVHAVNRSGSGTPVIIDLILNEIQKAPAVVSLLTPDDLACLREELRDEPKDDPKNIQEGYQPRPNVLLETGIALGALRDRTVLVVKDDLREVTNLGGVHVIRWQDTIEKRHELVERLKGLDLPVDSSGKDWQHVR